MDTNREKWVPMMELTPTLKHLLLSGYRKQDTLRFVQTVNYTDRTVLARTEEESRIFTMTLPIDAVVSANVFDLDVYEQEFAEKLIL